MQNNRKMFACALIAAVLGTGFTGAAIQRMFRPASSTVSFTGNYIMTPSVPCSVLRNENDKFISFVVRCEGAPDMTMLTIDKLIPGAIEGRGFTMMQFDAPKNNGEGK